MAGVSPEMALKALGRAIYAEPRCSVRHWEVRRRRSCGGVGSRIVSFLELL